jgi:predicted alpha-1,2-mannosidase
MTKNKISIRPVLKFAMQMLLILAGKALIAQPVYTYVDPLIGSKGKGNVFVGPSCPFGMIKPGPDCDVSSNSGYVSDSLQPVYGFSQTHVSGTGGGPKYGNVSLMPFCGPFDRVVHTSLREREKAHLGHYAVNLSGCDIDVELTASHKVAFYKFTFHDTSKRGIKIDLGTFLGEQPTPNAREAQQFVGSEVEIINEHEIRGYSRVRGGWNNGSAYTVFFHARFDQPFVESGTWKSGVIMPNQCSQYDSGEKTGAYAAFAQTSNKTVQVKIGISFLGTLKAKQNLETEIPHWDFDRVVQETQNKWENILGRLQISIQSPTDYKKMFYTALYHTYLMPSDRTGENPLWNSDSPYFDDFYAIWDTYRTSHPLMTLITPSKQVAIVNSLLDIYQNDGYMPDARSGNCNGRTQGGSNSDVLIADAYVKGLDGINYGQGLKAMLKNAMVPPGGNEEKEGRGGLADYNQLGYVSTRFVRSGNRTLEYAFNDYCIAQVAKGLGRMGEYRRFIQQSNNWKNLWRDIEDLGARGFIMPKSPNGQWVDSVECDIVDGRRDYVWYTPLSQEWPICVCWWCGFFYEGNSWEYSFFVPHDVPALIEMTGGKESFRKRLDIFFNNGYFDVSNEPSFLTPMLYHWIGRPDLSSDRVRHTIANHYSSDVDGLPGNDDSGAMSSWLAFHMMGLYPNAGHPYYLIHSPLVEKTAIKLETNKTFEIIAHNFSDKNKYIVSAKLNGKAYDRAWILHEDINKGGTLELEMGAKPRDWGCCILPPQ